MRPKLSRHAPPVSVVGPVVPCSRTPPRRAADSELGPRDGDPGVHVSVSRTGGVDGRASSPESHVRPIIPIVVAVGGVPDAVSGSGWKGGRLYGGRDGGTGCLREDREEVQVRV